MVLIRKTHSFVDMNALTTSHSMCVSRINKMEWEYVDNGIFGIVPAWN